MHGGQMMREGKEKVSEFGQGISLSYVEQKSHLERK